jgi:membrane-associated protein
MDFFKQVASIFLHVDDHLQTIISQYGAFTYALLFVVIFCETGLVILPFLPGDSLLFAAGAFSARGALHPAALIVLLSIAAIVGDACNYFVGSMVGRRAFQKNYRFLNQKHLAAAEKFYEKYGSKAIILARFVPIVRTLAPFVAGVSKMDYRTFGFYNVIGGILWVSICVIAGYFFGNIPVIQKNFEIVIIAIIVISIAPAAFEFLRSRRKRA